MPSRNSMKQKPTRLPNVVKIGYQEYKLVELSVQDDPLLADNTHGYTQDQRNIIVIDKDLPETKKKVVVFHELLHACRFIFQGDPPSKKADFEEWEHHFIGLWENTIPMVLKENKELREWLLND